MQNTTFTYQEFLQFVAGSAGIGGQDVNKNLQQQCEQHIKLFAQQTSDLFVQYLLQIIQTNTEEGYKQFAASQIRLNLSQFQVNGEQIWDKLQPQTQQNVKKILLSQIEIETSKICRNLLCDAIGEIASTCYEKSQSNNNQTGNEFSDIKELIWRMFSQNNEDIIEAGYHILSVYSTLSDGDFANLNSDLYTVYKLGIQHSNIKIQSAAIDALSQYVQIGEYKIVKNFESLLPALLESIYNIILKDDDTGGKCLASLHDISDCESKFFKKNFDHIFALVIKLYQNNTIDQQIKEQGLELIMSLIQKIPSVIKKSKENIKQTVDMIFLNMIQISETVEDEWLIPPEGFNDEIQEEAEFEKTKDGMNNINIIIESLGEQETLPIISSTIQNLLQSQDWRYVYSAIMALSQVGEFLDEVEDIKPILLILVKFIDHPNCKVRYSLCHALGQISEDMKPQFQENYMQDCVTVLMKLSDDPIQRVQAHALAAFSNLFECVDKTLILPHLKTILIKCFSMLDNQKCSLIKENAVSAIAAISEAAEDDFNQYYAESVPILFNMYENHKTKEYKQLRGNIIECISLIGYAVTQTIFEPDFHKLVNILINLQQQPLDDNDPSTAYIISGWQRLCVKYNILLKPYLPNIIPKLFEIIKQLVEDIQKEEQNDNLQKANTYIEDNVQLSLELISVFVDKLKQDFINYVQETITIISPLVVMQSCDEIKTMACKLIPDLINCVKLCNQPIDSLLNLFVDIFMKLIKEQTDPESEENFIDVIIECFKLTDVPFMNQENFQKFQEQLIELLKNSDALMNETQKDKIDEDVDEEELEIIDDDIHQIEELQVSICLLFGQLFRTHQMQSINLANFIYINLLPRLVQDTATKNMHKCGIYLIVDYIEFIGYQLCTDKWVNLLEALMKFSLNKSNVIRQAATYGIGIFAQKTPQDIFKQYANQIVQNLQEAHKIKKGEEKDKIYAKCQDNITAALGKIIEYQNSNVNLRSSIDYWLKWLPIKSDKSEAEKQHNLLFRILQENPNAIFENAENYELIIQIFGKLAVAKVCNKQVQQKMKLALNTLNNNQQFQFSWNKTYNSLTEQQKKKLTEIVNN